MTDYGLEIGLHANWNDKGAGVHYGEYSVTLRDSDLDSTVKAFLGLIEASFQWGMSKDLLAARIIEALEDAQTKYSPEGAQIEYSPEAYEEIS